jgi:hypothetical protein
VVKRIITGIVVLALALAIHPSSVAAQQGGGALALDVHIGFDSYAESGTWVPVRVIASNTGNDLKGNLRLVINPLTGGKVTYSVPADLPRGSRKQFMLYPADVPSFGSDLELQLVGGDGRVVASQKVKVQFVENTTLLVGVWSDTPGVLASWGKVKPSSGKSAIANLTVEDLPEAPEAWNALDVLVVSDTDTGKLSDAQRLALEGWVSQGGRLVIIGGASASRTLTGLADFSPMAATGSANTSLEPFATATGKAFPQGAPSDGLVATGTASSGSRVLIKSGNIPLVIAQTMGYGRVDFVAADPALEPLRSWPTVHNLWTLILTDGTGRPGWGYDFSTNWETARQAVAAVPGVSLPSVFQLCGFLAAYVVLIGPVNYFVLRRLKRRELAWVTVPALVALFTAVAYITGFQIRGTQVILHRLSVIETWPGSDTARVRSLLGVWSPNRRSYDIQLEPGFVGKPLPRDLSGALTSIDETIIENSDTSTLKGVNVDIGSVTPFVLEGYTTSAPRVEGNLEITVDSGGVHVTGDILNQSDMNIRQATLMLGGGSRVLGDLPAGKVIRVDEIITSGMMTPANTNGLDPYPGTTNNYYYGYGNLLAQEISGSDCYTPYDSFGSPQNTLDQRACKLANSIVISEQRGSEIYLTGWMDSAPFATNVLNASSEIEDVVLFVAQLESRLSNSSPALAEIPPGLMTWQQVGNSTSYYSYSPYELYLDPTTEAIYRFVPLRYVRLPEINTIDLDIQGYDNTIAAPRIDIWNVPAGKWDLIEVKWGLNTIRQAAQYVDASGGVTVRIASTTTDYGVTLSRFEITLKAQ